MSSLIPHATAYAAKGLRPFPILPNSKKPATGNGFHDAASDPADIERLFKNHRGNIGVTPDDTVFVLDVDTKHGDGYAALEELQERLGRLPKTLRAKTPSGGMHLYFRKPADAIVPNAANVLAQNIDFRTSKGYVVAAPSTIEGNAYAFHDADADIADAPQAWLDALANWKPASATAATDAGGEIIAGGRNQALTRIAGAMQRHGMDSGAIIAALAEHIRIDSLLLRRWMCTCWITSLLPAWMCFHWRKKACWGWWIFRARKRKPRRPKRCGRKPAQQHNGFAAPALRGESPDTFPA